MMLPKKLGRWELRIILLAYFSKSTFGASKKFVFLEIQDSTAIFILHYTFYLNCRDAECQTDPTDGVDFDWDLTDKNDSETQVL